VNERVEEGRGGGESGGEGERGRGGEGESGRRGERNKGRSLKTRNNPIKTRGLQHLTYTQPIE